MPALSEIFKAAELVMFCPAVMVISFGAVTLIFPAPVVCCPLKKIPIIKYQPNDPVPRIKIINCRNKIITLQNIQIQPYLLFFFIKNLINNELIWIINMVKVKYGKSIGKETKKGGT
ncbi:hypothetical protein B0A77_11340 [Flavobacterium branchiophilum]|uniref:Uncharacterized protein n=1 Tax=Flavobacterium branchiophilum TaxID=55197 RepID=A0A2H3K9Y9_9FLAO|nr:hypothetical protein B0A77_11340 [Flavobacterium branchiophilum]